MNDPGGARGTELPLERDVSGEAQGLAATPRLHTATATRHLAQPATARKAVAAALILYCVLAACLFYDTLASMVTIWLRSQTFAHGFLILPISLWLLWRMRKAIDLAHSRPEPRALVLILAAGLAWLLGHLVDVRVVEQLAFVAVIVAGVWTILGTALTRRAAFPLGFLFLAVPMGEWAIAPLMEFTADTTEFLLRLSEIPVFREGMFLTLPTGTWSVIEECSGVRYLVASVTLGLLYAYLTYYSPWRRAVFVLAAIIVPILANSIRAYAVVMVGHASEMRIGIGGDHLIYGWVFFGLVMMAMFWIGGLWQQPVVQSRVAAPSPPQNRTRSILSVAGLAILCAGLWPAAALTLNRDAAAMMSAELAAPAAQGNWQWAAAEDGHWRPALEDADRQLDQTYVGTAAATPEVVGLHLRQYLQQRRGVELVSGTDPWRPDRKRWRVVSRQPHRIDLGGVPLQVDEAWLADERENLLAWSWYRIDGRDTANPYVVKLLEARQQIVAGRRSGTRVFIATPMASDAAQARPVLQKFLAAHHEAIAAALEQGVSE
ncbi:MAG: exosortase A [Porticoccaceae bacterium]